LLKIYDSQFIEGNNHDALLFFLLSKERNLYPMDVAELIVKFMYQMDDAF
jgi:hypothetical protein